MREKFAIEGKAGRYRDNGINSTSDLPSRFMEKKRIRALLHEDWDRLSTDEIYFLQAEQGQKPEARLLESSNVERLALEFWEPTLAQL